MIDLWVYEEMVVGAIRMWVGHEVADPLLCLSSVGLIMSQRNTVRIVLRASVAHTPAVWSWEPTEATFRTIC
jgi:hypothetical protein